MIVIPFAILWAAYGVAMQGYVMTSGRNVSVKQIWSPVGYLTGSFPAKGSANPSDIFPTGS
jgi:hypothetical protein